MNDEQNCRQAFDDFYHKIKAEVSYDHWCSIWRFISKRQARGNANASNNSGEPVAVCVTCGGSGMVDDGEIDCYENGEPYENGPVKCVKDCPDCVPKPQQIPGPKPVGEAMSSNHRSYAEGWNACRAAMLEAAPEPKGDHHG